MTTPTNNQPGGRMVRAGLQDNMIDRLEELRRQIDALSTRAGTAQTPPATAADQETGETYRLAIIMVRGEPRVHLERVESID